MAQEIINTPAVLPEAMPMLAESPLSVVVAAHGAGMTPETLQGFMELFREQQRVEAEQAFNEAFSAFKKEGVAVVKNSLVDFMTKAGRTTYKHATLGEMVEAVSPALAKHGLSQNWETEVEEGKVKVTCILRHKMGHKEKTSMAAGMDTSGGKNAIQAAGSTITYLQRYTLQTITGIALLDDDDGRGHLPPQQPQSQKKSEKKKEDGTLLDKAIAALDKYAAPGRTLDELLEAWPGFEAHGKKTLSKEAYQKLENYKNQIEEMLMEAES